MDNEIDMEFIERAIRLTAEGKTDAALDIIYDNICGMLDEGKYEEVDLILETVDVKRLSVDIFLGLLTTTLITKTKLKSRDSFFSRVEQIARNRGEWEDGLLLGLET